MSDSDESSCHDDKSQMSYSSFHNPAPPNDGQPYIEIIEQPQSRGFRFRYECEGKSHGGLQGESSRREKKSFPTVRICNYQGPARIIVSLVTDEKEPKPHAHELIGKNCSNGTCCVSIKGDNMTVSFPNLGIRHVTKKSVTKILVDRLRESLKADKMMDGQLGQDAELIPLTYEEENEIQRQADCQAKNMPLSVVRLSFRCYLLDANSACFRVLPPVISNPIYDSKAPCAALLKICRMDKVGGCCVGNEEVFLLCDKVQRDDIAIRFYEQDDEGNVKWEDYGNFAAHDVHRQYAIVFRTPPYINTNIDRPVTVHVQLRRFSDQEVSDPKTFTYYPQQTDFEDIQKKRRKQIPIFSDGDGFSSVSNSGAFSAAGMVQSALNGFDKTTFNSHLSTGHESLSSAGHSDYKFPRPVAISRLEEDSATCTEWSCDLVSRGAQPSSKHIVHGMSDDANTNKQQTALPSSCTEQTPLSDTQSSQDTALASSQSSLTASRESELIGLLYNLSIRTAQSVQRYAETGDSRHLLLPARHLIPCSNEDGDNAVHLSVINNCHSAAVNLLSVLSTLPDCLAINEINNALQSPLQLAVLTRQSDLVELLLSHGAAARQIYDKRSGDSLLHTCARCGDDACLSHLLKYWHQSDNANKWQPGIDEKNFEGFTALHLAVRGGHLACVKLLVTVGGADVNASDGRSGRTVLHHAVLTNNLAIVGYLLLECGVDVDKPDDTGNTSLHYATATNKLGVAALLVAANADADCENIDFDISDDDSDNEDDCQHFQDLSGKTARDLASGNPKMLRVLDGESYSSVSDSPASGDQLTDNIRFKSFCDSGLESFHANSSEQPGQELTKLDAVIRMKLSKLLESTDHQNRSDWRQLAAQLGFSQMNNVFEMQKNPTLSLLDNFELAGGSAADLRKGLVEINRKDAVELIDSALQPPASQSAEL